MQAGPETVSQTPSPAAPEQGFAALPLRARGTLEILDTAIKVYKQYFWVLIGWSAIVAAGGSIPYISSFLWIFLWPLVIGACVCCITAAVRGQQVKFSQCSQFTRPRYGPLLGTMFFAMMIFVVLLIAVVIAAVFIGIASASTLGLLPTAVQVVLWILLFLAVVVLMSVSAVWLNTALIVVCMEEGVHSSRAMGRSFELLKGYWVRVSTLVTLLSLAMLALVGALYGAGALMIGIGNIPSMLDGKDFEGFATVLIVMTLVSALVGTIWYPVFYITLALFYLDLRIRKEALDIEWGAHLSTKDSLPERPAMAAAGVWAPQTDISLQQGQPSFRAALAEVNSGAPGATAVTNSAAPIAAEQQAAWLGNTTPAPPDQVAAPVQPPSVVTPTTPIASSQQTAWFDAQPAPAPAPPPAPVAPAEQAAWFGAASGASTATAATTEPVTPAAATAQPAPVDPPPAAPTPEAPRPSTAAARVLCVQCGHSSPAGQVFCMNCGARLQASGDSSSSSAQW